MIILVQLRFIARMFHAPWPCSYSSTLLLHIKRLTLHLFYVHKCVFFTFLSCQKNTKETHNSAELEGSTELLGATNR